MKAHCVVLFLILACTSQAAAQPAKADAGRITQLIKALDSTQFAAREQATRALLALEGQALEPLRDALKTSNSLELTRRIETMLQQLAIYEPGGDVVNGLKIRLTIDRPTAKVGDTVTLQTTLCNMTDRPMNIVIGHSTCGNFIECGSALRHTSTSGKPDVKPDNLVGGFYRSSRSGPIFVTLPPKSVKRYNTPLTITQHKDGQITATLGTEKYFGFNALRQSDHLRMSLGTNSTEDAVELLQAMVKARGTPGENAPFWSGVIRSNDVQLKIVP